MARAGARDNISIEKNATFQRTYTITDTATGSPVDLTGFTVAMDIRQQELSTNALVELTEGDGITVTPLAGQIEVVIPDEDTIDYTFTQAVYDIRLESPSGVAEFPIFGSVVVNPTSTR